MAPERVSQILLEEANPRGDREWEDFLDGDTDGTLFHRLSFLAYHPEGRFRAHPLKARLDGRLLAVIPLADGEGESDGDVASPYGGSFGGFACVAGLGAAEHTALLDAVLAWARERGYGSLWISAPPTASTATAPSSRWPRAAGAWCAGRSRTSRI
jgi:hypothetical protein